MKKNIVIAVSVLIAVMAAVVVYNIVIKSAPSGKKAAVTEAKPEEETVMVETARKHEASGDLLKAKESYQKAIEKFPSSSDMPKIQEALEGVNIKLLFSPSITANSVSYEVEKGDNLTKIAKKFNTTIDLIMKSNNLKDASIKIAQKLKISKAKFSIVVDKSQNILTLKSDGEILKTYPVATGKNSSTPVGTFIINNKTVNPTWYPTGGGMIPPGDPKNVLGSRWMGINKEGYGIHGTTQPESIGKSVTEGCVRMKNSDVEEIYTIVPEGTEVVIID